MGVVGHQAVQTVATNEQKRLWHVGFVLFGRIQVQRMTAHHATTGREGVGASGSGCQAVLVRLLHCPVCAVVATAAPQERIERHAGGDAIGRYLAIAVVGGRQQLWVLLVQEQLIVASRHDLLQELQIHLLEEINVHIGPRCGKDVGSAIQSRVRRRQQGREDPRGAGGGRAVGRRRLRRRGWQTRGAEAAGRTAAATAGRR